MARPARVLSIAAATAAATLSFLTAAGGPLPPAGAQVPTTTSTTAPCRNGAGAPIPCPTTTSTTVVTTTSTTVVPGPSTTAAPQPTTTLPLAGPTTTSSSTTTTSTTALPLGTPPTPTTGLPLAIPTTAPSPSIAGPGNAVRNLEATALEITQGTQNLANDMPAVSGRQTMARAYVRSEDGDVTGVRGILGGWRGQTFLGTVSASNQPILAHTSGSDREDTDGTLNFHVPDGWTNDGVTRFTVFVYQATVDFTLDNESDVDDNFFQDYVEFNDADPLLLHLSPLHLHQDYDGSLPETTFGDSYEDVPGILELLAGLDRTLPISDIDVFLSLPLYPDDHAQGAEFDLLETSLAESGEAWDPLEVLLASQTASTQFSDWQWYGLVPPGTSMGFWSKKSNSIFNVAGMASGGVSYGMIGTDPDPEALWYLQGPRTLGHEVSHNRGRAHYMCVGTEDLSGGIEPEFPTGAPNCTLSVPTASGYWGFDVVYQSFDYLGAPTAISPMPDAELPHLALPLMTNASYRWLDPYTYCKLLPTFGVPCDAYPPAVDDGLGLSIDEEGTGAADVGIEPISYAVPLHGDGGGGGNAEPTGMAGPAVQVRGVVTDPDGAARLNDVQVLAEVSAAAVAAAEHRQDEAAEADPPSPWVLVIEGPGGERIERALASLNQPDHDQSADEVAESFPFLDVVPVDFEPVAVRVERSGAVVAERLPSPAAPVVHVDAPNGGAAGDPVTIAWTASDPDGDALTFDVLLSGDAGETWDALAIGTSEPSITVENRLLPSTTDGVIRVVARDGFRTATDDSDAPVEITGGGPSFVGIMSPADGRTFALHDLVVLRGIASDVDDGVLSDMTWASDLDGPLGTGTELATRSLSPGTHRITLTATDAGGASASYEIGLVVLADVEADVPTDEELAGAEDLFTAHLADDGTSGQPVSSNDDGDGGVLLAVGAAVLVGGAAAGAAVSRRRRRQPAA